MAGAFRYYAIGFMGVGVIERVEIELAVPARRNSRFAEGVLAVVALMTTVALWLSLKWPLQHDAPLLHYVAWAMDRFGVVPYRDIFETSMPGTFAFHWLIGTLFGWGDTGIRITDLALMAGLAAATWRLMRPFGARPALAAPVLFTLSYLWLGPDMSLQRDYVGMILVVWAVLLGTLGSGRCGWARLVSMGLLFGLAALIKPHLVIGLMPLSWYLLWRRREADPGLSWRGAALAVLPVMVMAMVIPGAAALVVLYRAGALPAFLELVREYLPLHLLLTGDHETIEGWARVNHLIEGTVFMRGLWFVVPAAIAGGFVAEAATRPGGPSGGEPRARLILLLGLAGAYLIYPAFAGQFFFYHWAPFQYVLVLFGALCFADPQPGAEDAQRWGLGFVAFAVVVMVVLVGIPPVMKSQLTRHGVPAAKFGAVDRMESALRRYLRPGDTVQPLDWTGGAIHAMLRTEARLATRFMYDYHFYHHVDRPIIATLRARFMDELQRSAPHLVLDVRAKPRVSGDHTSDRFPELEVYLADRYRVVVDDVAFRLLERVR
jgi:hypothetical protein